LFSFIAVKISVFASVSFFFLIGACH